MGNGSISRSGPIEDINIIVWTTYHLVDFLGNYYGIRFFSDSIISQHGLDINKGNMQ
jgi:hypothetical protein